MKNQSFKVYNLGQSLRKRWFYKRILCFLIILLLTLSGCTQGVPQKDYDDLRINYQSLQQKLDHVFVLGTCSGYLVATVRGFSQDYVSDEADKMVIVTEFQSAPFMIMLDGEQLQTLEIGTSYVFNVENKDVTLISDEFMTQTTNIQQLLLQYQLKIVSVSLATEPQSGLNGSTLSCIPKD